MIDGLVSNTWVMRIPASFEFASHANRSIVQYACVGVTVLEIRLITTSVLKFQSTTKLVETSALWTALENPELPKSDHTFQTLPNIWIRCPTWARRQPYPYMKATFNSDSEVVISLVWFVFGKSNSSFIKIAWGISLTHFVQECTCIRCVDFVLILLGRRSSSRGE